MRRRDFIGLLTGAAAAGWPLSPRAQQPMIPVIGFLNGNSREAFATRLRFFHQGLAEAGYVEGHNVAIEYRWANGENDRLPELAADLVHRRVNAIAVASGTPPVLAAKAATSSIPIVFAFGNDPVQLSLVANLRHPGGNITGATSMSLELVPKRLELLHEMMPTARRVAAIVNPTNPNSEAFSRNLHEAARVLGLDLKIVPVSVAQDIDQAFARLSDLSAAALIVGNDPLFDTQSDQIGALALRHRMPAISGYRQLIMAGGLMGYGSIGTEIYRIAGVYVGRVLKGEKPADLPVQQAENLELIINLKTAKALDLTVPPALIARANEVIE